jgi:hypothetical protein
LIIVIVIIGILAAVAIPKFASLNNDAIREHERIWRKHSWRVSHQLGCQTGRPGKCNDRLLHVHGTLPFWMAVHYRLVIRLILPLSRLVSREPAPLLIRLAPTLAVTNIYGA